MRLIMLVLAIHICQTSTGQMIFYKDNFSSKLSSVEDINFDSTNNIGVAIPIYLLKKYDKVDIWFFEKEEDDSKWKSLSYHAPISLEPKSRKFRDNYGSQKYVYAYITAENEIPSKYKDLTVLYEKLDGKRLRFHKTKFMVRVGGYFAEGEDSRWNSNTDSFESYTKYEFSKYFLESKEISFAKDEKALAEEQARKEKKNLEEKNSTLNGISSMLMNYASLHEGNYKTTDLWKSINYSVNKANEKYEDEDVKALAADIDNFKSRYYKIKRKYDPIPMTEGLIWRKYKIARKFLLESNSYIKEIELQKKIVELMKVKTKILKTAIGEEEDPEKIIDFIMNYKVE